jgi:hypothetical protein
MVVRKTKSARFDAASTVSNRLPRVQSKRRQHPGEWLLRRPSRLLGHEKRARACGNEPPGAQPQGPGAQSALDELQVGN